MKAITRIIFVVLFYSFISSCGPACINTCGYTEPPLTGEISTPASLLNSAAPASAQLEAPWDARDQDLMRIAKNRTPTSDVVLGAIFQTVTSCSNGGTKTDIQDNVPPPWYSQGDSYTTVYDACVTGNTQTDGQQSYSVDVLKGQPYVDASWSTGTTIARDLSRTNLTTGEVTYAIGSASEQLSVVDNTEYTQLLSGSSNRNWLNNGEEQVGIEQYQVNYAWDETTQQYQWDFDVSSTNTAFGDSSAVTTQTLIGTLGSPPESGQFQSIKSQNDVSATSTVTATGGGNVLIETDSDSDGLVDSTTNSTWNQLLLDSILNQFI